MSAIDDELREKKEELKKYYEREQKMRYGNHTEKEAYGVREMITDLEYRIIELELIKEMEVIQPYLIDKNPDFKIYKNNTLLCDMIKHGNLRYIEYIVQDKSKKHFPNITHGKMIFNTAGEVLLDLEINGSCDFLHRYIQKDRGFEEVEDKEIFIDDENMIINLGGLAYKNNYVHYQLRNGKLECAHSFTMEDIVNQTGHNWGDWNHPAKLEFLTAHADKGLVTYCGRLYSALEGRYLNDINFDVIYDKDSYAKENGKAHDDDEIKDFFYTLLNNNNCLHFVHTIPMSDDGKESVNLIGFLDTEGEIIGKVSCSIDFKDLSTNPMDIKVTNKDYLSLVETLCDFAKSEDASALLEKKRILDDEVRAQATRALNDNNIKFNREIEKCINDLPLQEASKVFFKQPNEVEKEKVN